MLIVNQTRTKMGVMFGDNMTTPGGQGLKFLASLRLKISGGKANKNDLGDHMAKDILFHAPKNRMGPPWRKCRVRLDYEKGWDNEWSVVDFGKERKILKPRSRGKKAYDEVIEALGWKTSTDHVKDDE
jgi:RecA/RadA recombinase